MIILRNKSFSFLKMFKKLNDWELKREQEAYRRKENKNINFPQTKSNSSGYAMHINPRVDTVSPKHSTLRKIFDDIYNKYNPGWGDGDEYPAFYIYDIEDAVSDSDYRLGDIITESQYPYVYRYEGKGWIMVEDPDNFKVSPESPKRIPNIKQELLRIIKLYKKEYQEDYGKNTPYDKWEDIKDSVDAVLNYLNRLEIEIKRSRL